MKKTFLIIAAIAAGLVSCSKQEGPAGGDEPSGEERQEQYGIVSFSGIAAPRGKVSVDAETGANAWVEGDRIMIYYEGGNCEAVADRSGSTATFTTVDPIPKDKDCYCAIYPSTRQADFDGSDLTVDWTQHSQPAYIGHAAIATAKTTVCGGDFAFENAGAIIRFTTKSNKIHEVRVRIGEDNYLATVGTSSPSVPYAAGTYYIPIPAGRATEGFSLRLKDYEALDYPAYYRPADRTFEKSVIYDIGTVEDKVFTEPGIPAASFRLMSFNIQRGDINNERGDWAARKDACLAMIAADSPDILGLQECNSQQRNDILAEFPKYGAVGVSVYGKGISPYTNESSNPILYDGNKFELERQGKFWLSETPGTAGSYTWYWDKPRMATWAQFRVKGSTLHFVYVCLHLQSGNEDGINAEYAGRSTELAPDCRERELGVVTNKLATINPSGYPLVISGDFNATASEDYFEALRSKASLASETAPASDMGNTFNGTPHQKLDHIFCNGVIPSVYAVDRNAYVGKTFVSDHYPVYADFSFPSFGSSLPEYSLQTI